MFNRIISVILLIFIISGCRQEPQHTVSMKLVESYSFVDLISSLESANRLLAVRDSSITVSNTSDSEFEEYAKSNPIYAVMLPNITQDSDGRFFASDASEIGFIKVDDTAKLLTYFNDSAVAALFPPNMSLLFVPNPNVGLSVYAIKRDVTAQELTEDQIKYFEFQGSGISGLTRINFLGDVSLFFIHPKVDLILKLPADKTYTLVMAIDSTTLAGSLETTNSASSVKMNSISNDLKQVIKKMFKDKVIEN